VKAKEFLASRIVEEADREGAPLSEIERKILQVVVRPPGDRLKLWTTGLVVTIAICVVGVLDTRYNLGLERFWPSNEIVGKLWLSAWIAAVVVAVLYTSFRIIFGPKRAADMTDRILFKMFGSAQPDSKE
jgi:hypothetical protein